MNEKMPCVECGTPIPVSKSGRMKGLCVRCFAKRKRPNLNPFADLYVSLLHKIHETDGGFDALNEPEKLYYTVALLRNEINNGGFHQYFFNSSGSYYDHAEAGLTKLGATQTLALLHQAKEITFPGESVPADTEARRNHMASLDPDPEQSELMRKLGVLQRFYAAPDEITPRLEAFASEQQLV